MIISPDGEVSACYLLRREWEKRGLDLKLGRLEGEGKMLLNPEAIERVRHLVTEKPRCERCFCRWTCAGGCHVNQSYPGCPETYNNFCIQTRIITAGSLLFELECETLADELLHSRPAMERLTMNPSDRLEAREYAAV